MASPPEHDLAALYRAHGPAVLRRARTMLRDPVEAEEILHELFVRLSDRPELLRGVQSPGAWITTATTRACLNRLRDSGRRRQLLSERVLPMQSRARAAQAENRAVVADLIAQLPPPLDAVAVHAWLDGMSRSELAQVLGCSDRHASRLIRAAREQLRALAAPASDRSPA